MNFKLRIFPWALTPILGGSGGGSGRNAALYAALFAGWFYWLLRYPYEGIRHDAILYGVLVARHLDPPAYARDLLFAFGSQDSFSAFTPIYGVLVQTFGLDLAARSVVLAGGLLWVCASVGLSCVVFRKHWLGWFAAFLLVSTPFNYSPNHETFFVFENFATARIVAFPLAVLALMFALIRADVTAFVMVLAATCLHPLLGFWSLALLLAIRWPLRVYLTCSISAALLLLSGPFWSPVEGLQLMDAKWLATVRLTSVDVLPGGWEAFRLGAVFFWGGLLCLAARYGAHTVRPLYSMTALLLFWGELIALVTAHYWPVQIVIQAQPWRVLWLAQVIGVLAGVDVLRNLLRRGALLFFIALMILGGLAAIDALETVWPMGVLIGLAIPQVRRRVLVVMVTVKRHRARWLLLLGGVLTISLPFYWQSLGISGNTLPLAWGSDFPEWRGLVLRGGGGVFFLFLAASLRSEKAARVMAMLAVVACVFAIKFWDVRNAVQKQLESRYLSPKLDSAVRAWMSDVGLRRGEVVAWAGGDLETWFVLRTAYFGGSRDGRSPAPQAVGLVFSKARMAEIIDRFSLLQNAKQAEAGGRNQVGSQKDGLGLHQWLGGVPGNRGAKVICASGKVDWLVVSNSVTIDAMVRPLPAPFANDVVKTPLLVRCASISASFS